MELDKLIAELTELRKTLPGNAKVRVCFETPNESWEEDALTVCILKWDNGTPDAVGIVAEFAPDDDDDDDEE